jgi:hypothetical protein
MTSHLKQSSVQLCGNAAQQTFVSAKIRTESSPASPFVRLSFVVVGTADGAPTLLSFFLRAVLGMRPLGVRTSILGGCINRRDSMPSTLQLNIHTAASAVAVSRCNVVRKRAMHGKTPASYLHHCLRGLTGCSKPTLTRGASSSHETSRC